MPGFKERAGLWIVSERKKKILAAVIEEYIETAEPVGSKTLAETAGLGCSSATIRNELAELVAMGYLEQPHTSAGRVPSAKGYRLYRPGMELKSGDRVYSCNRGKAVMLARIGKKPLDQGIQLAAAHIDSPRLDLKPSPLYEDSELAFLKTHYYGGIRKYQWVTIPLALHGVVIRKDGAKAAVHIGEEEGEPRLVITDLLPHFGRGPE